jgi:ribosomal protein RSM22 (predicted rRNA methylase)
MRLPRELLAAIEPEIEGVNRRALARASRQLGERYKAADFTAPLIQDEAQRAAYLAVRLPATYAANWRVLTEIRTLAPQVEILSMLDLGAGPGTALFAAAEVLPELKQATLLESAEGWLPLGQRITRQSKHPTLSQAQWIRRDLRSGLDCGLHDLVIISYALGEMVPSVAEVLLRRAWNCARQFLVVIEPGTPRGFSVVHTARAAMIAAQAHILAPCPHNLACPMAGTRDWCHFAQRLERTSQHRQLKQAALGYEDEKFSYVVASREPLPAAAARIVRHPQKHSGHIRLTLCAGHSIETRIVTRSQAQLYKLARQAEWGGVWNSVVWNSVE